MSTTKGLRYGGDDEITTATQRLIVESIRVGLSTFGSPLAKAPMTHSLETFDFGHQIAHCLTMYVARLPEKGTLKVSWPATWWQHLKQAVYDWHGWYRWRATGRLASRARQRWPVRLHEETHEASHYFPAVKLPAEYRDGEMLIWNG